MMIKHKKIIIGSAVIILLASSVLWSYGEQSNTQQVSAKAEQSLDSGVALFKQKKYNDAIEIFENVQPGQEPLSKISIFRKLTSIWPYANSIRFLKGKRLKIEKELSS